MGEPQQSIGAAFPAPPPFYKHFTEANLSRYSELVTGSSTDPSPTRDTHSSAHSSLDLPPELRYLRPPSPPQDGKYRCFGEELEVRLLSLSILQRQRPNIGIINSLLPLFLPFPQRRLRSTLRPHNAAISSS